MRGNQSAQREEWEEHGNHRSLGWATTYILYTKLYTDVQHRLHVKHVAMTKTYIYSLLAHLHCRGSLRVYQETIVLHPVAARPLTHSQEINGNSLLSPAALEFYSNCTILEE